MMKLLKQHNDALKRAARLIIAYEARIGAIALVDDHPAYPANTAAINQEIKQALAEFRRWQQRHGDQECAHAAILAMWASGAWRNRDTCARLCYWQAGFSNMALARQALVGAPPPRVAQ
ncbi:hypothetical protein [Chromobacterium aquaticum]|uniref:Uncharacterized protein n=1 Tax=Chromobacterium aquaticum TaxID=467180 RepID=A0ABV8ZPR9_9NEIS|nr:hypothetical protein [Chromobacterium aquaticum]MCD5364427.1 hypothetical protein [Chromobacterium aquaticum]